MVASDEIQRRICVTKSVFIERDIMGLSKNYRYRFLVNLRNWEVFLRAIEVEPGQFLPDYFFVVETNEWIPQFTYKRHL